MPAGPHKGKWETHLNPERQAPPGWRPPPNPLPLREGANPSQRRFLRRKGFKPRVPCERARVERDQTVGGSMRMVNAMLLSFGQTGHPDGALDDILR